MKRFAAILMLLFVTVSCAHAATYPIVTDRLVTLIDENGEELLPEGSYDDIITLLEGKLFLVGKPGSYLVYNCEDNVYSDTVSMADVVGNYIIFRQGSVYGVMDYDTSVLIEALYAQIVPNGEGGFIATKGSPYDDLEDEIFCVDLASEADDIKTGVKIISSLSEYHDGWMPICFSDGSYGYIDPQGKTGLGTFLFADSFENGYARVVTSEGEGLIRSDGTYAYGPTDAQLFVGKNFQIAYGSDHTVTLIRNGMEFTEFNQIQSVSVLKNGFVLTDEHSTTLYNASGHVIYSSESSFTATEGNDGQWILRCGEWGEPCCCIVNSIGETILDGQANILSLGYGYYACMSISGETYYSDTLQKERTSYDYSSVRYGLVNDKGSVILPKRFTSVQALSVNRLLLENDEGIYLTDGSGTVIQSWVG